MGKIIGIPDHKFTVGSLLVKWHVTAKGPVYKNWETSIFLHIKPPL